MRNAARRTGGELGQVLDTARLFDDFSRPWMVAGGWAVDLFLGRSTRRHKDVDISVFRQDQLTLQAYLQGWQLYVAHGGKLSAWLAGEYLELPYHGIWAWPPDAVAGRIEDSPELEILLNERSETHWLYRRNPSITRDLERTCLWGCPACNIPYLAPEIALLYKSREPRIEDNQDFEAVWPALDFEQQEWLRQALQIRTPDHPWLRWT